MTDKGGGASLLPYTPAGVTGSDEKITVTIDAATSPLLSLCLAS